jgi:nitrite reductase/ring-hydroxylating ferredoxin subunit
MSGDPRHPPFPNSWYFLGFAADLPAGGVWSRTVAGQDLVVFRTAGGSAAVFAAYCPHMGAHLGHGGTVEGETLRCPFHAFRFDASGACVATPYGAPPARAVCRTWPLREVNGFLMTYYHAEHKAPDWELPEVDSQGWTPVLSRAWELSGHPQDIAENSVDLGHMGSVHLYDDVDFVEPVRTEGRRLDAHYVLHRTAEAFGHSGRKTRAEADIHVYGLGYTVADLTVEEFGIRTRHFVFVTPVTAGRTLFRIALSLRRITHPRRIHPLLALAPRRLLDWLIRATAFRTFVHDVEQDFDILNHKVYLPSPRLVQGDGPIARYRAWARQFYSVPGGLDAVPDGLDAAPAAPAESPAAGLSTG